MSVMSLYDCSLSVGDAMISWNDSSDTPVPEITTTIRVSVNSVVHENQICRKSAHFVLPSRKRDSPRRWVKVTCASYNGRVDCISPGRQLSNMSFSCCQQYIIPFAGVGPEGLVQH
jgi:hypothetical protein